MLTVSARLFHPETLQPWTVSRIFMHIQSVKDGHEVWPLEVVRKNAAGFDILIGTSEMKENHDYLVRVSNNWNMSPMGWAEFHVKKKETGVPPLFIPVVGVPGIRIPVDDIAKKEIVAYVYRTQMDHRVCPICKGYENIVFEVDEWKPNIPDDTHPRCRCTYDIIFKEKEEKTASLQDMARVIKVAQTGKKGMQVAYLLENLNTIESQL